MPYRHSKGEHMRLCFCVSILALALAGCVRSGYYSGYSYSYGYGYSPVPAYGMYSGFYSPFYGHDSVYVHNTIINRRYYYDDDHGGHRPRRGPHEDREAYHGGDGRDTRHWDGGRGGPRRGGGPRHQGRGAAEGGQPAPEAVAPALSPSDGGQAGGDGRRGRMERYDPAARQTARPAPSYNRQRESAPSYTRQRDSAPSYGGAPADRGSRGFGGGGRGGGQRR